MPKGTDGASCHLTGKAIFEFLKNTSLLACSGQEGSGLISLLLGAMAFCVCLQCLLETDTSTQTFSSFLYPSTYKPT